jgi:hypothetical protein
LDDWGDIETGAEKRAGEHKEIHKQAQSNQERN